MSDRRQYDGAMLPTNWKGTVVWSGTTALATWLASAAPVVAPRVATGPVSGHLEASTNRAVVTRVQDLSEEAARLSRRISGQDGYTEPSRDPFRFRPAAVPAPARPAAVLAPPPAAASVAPPAVQPPPFVLSGIAEDRQGEAVIRTAVIAGSGDLWLVKAGEKIEGKFQVTAVDADAVELIRADTGTALRLMFRP